MSKNTIVVASTIAAAGALSGCHFYEPKGVFKDELIKVTNSKRNNTVIVQWLNHPDSPAIYVPEVYSKHPESGYYVASGQTSELNCDNSREHATKNGINFVDLKEITKEQADSMRKTVTYQEAVDASRKAQAGKDSGLVK